MDSLDKNNTIEQSVYKTLVRQNPEDTEKSNYLQRTTWALLFVAIASNLGQITIGLMFSWISPVAEKILSIDPNINPFGTPVSVLELSIIGAAIPTGIIIGPFLGKLFDVFGRKKILLAISLTMTLSLLILAYSSLIYVFCVLLVIVGMCIGALNVGYPLYISEIAEDHNRGKIMCLVQTGLPLGTVICFITGPYLSFTTFTLTCAIPIMLNVVSILFIIPESPVKLIKLRKIEDAKKVIKYLRQKSDKELKKEINRIEGELENTSNTKQGGCMKLLTNKSSRNGLISAGGAYNILVFNGTLALTSYLQVIFDKTETNIPSNISALLVAIVQLFCYVAAIFVVDTLGRRKIIFYSTLLSIIPLLCIGFYFHFQQRQYAFINNIKWLPVTLMMVFNILNNFGNTTVPIALMNDMFTEQVKATALSVIVILYGIIFALTTFGMPIVMESIGIQWCFWIFTVNSVIASVFAFFLVPETKGKNIFEIQKILKDLI